MILNIALYLSLALFSIGLLYKMSAWFRYSIGPGAGEIGAAKRVIAAVRGIGAVFFSLSFFTLVKSLVLDLLLQRKITREDLLRSLMHFLIYVGFTLLVLMHALHRILTSKLFPDYSSTINPFMFLRDLFGMMVIAGLCIALYRRFIAKVPRLATSGADIYLIAITGVIIITGILLEGIKITSYTRYREMVADYPAAETDEESKALESFWVKEFRVRSPDRGLPFDAAALSLGKAVHERSCASCHSNPRWAFSGFAAATAFMPVAGTLDAAGLPSILYYVHYIACLLALAYLPYSKAFHMIATPLCILSNAVIDERTSDPANLATKRMIELDACVHCGTCSLRCSALAAAVVRKNPDILPSEKMQHLKSLARGKALGRSQLAALQEGVYLCTNCDRCTVVCPAGIRLRELWFQAREDLIHAGYPLPIMLSPLSYYRGLMKERLSGEYYASPLSSTIRAVTASLTGIKNVGAAAVPGTDPEFMKGAGLPVDAATFSSCFSCSTCTSTCPVVQSYDNPKERLGLLPHQIIHAVALGIVELALGSNMIWDCLTCYKCQENCPQKVRIPEIFFWLKNIASASLVVPEGTRTGSTADGEG